MFIGLANFIEWIQKWHEVLKVHYREQFYHKFKESFGIRWDSLTEWLLCEDLYQSMVPRMMQQAFFLF